MKEESENLYQILGIESTASAEAIKSAYKSLSQMYHPDKNKGRMEEFIKIRDAYKILSNKERKAIYDLGILQGFTHQEFKASMNMILNSASEHIIESIVNSNSFPSPTIKTIAKSFIVVERGKANVLKEQGVKLLKKVNKSISKTKGKSNILERLDTKLGKIRVQIKDLEVHLAVYDYLQDENKLLEEIKDKEQGLFAPPPGAFIKMDIST